MVVAAMFVHAQYFSILPYLNSIGTIKLKGIQHVASAYPQPTAAHFLQLRNRNQGSGQTGKNVHIFYSAIFWQRLLERQLLLSS